MQKTVVKAVRFDSKINNSSEIFKETGVALVTERRPNGNTFLHYAPHITVNHGDWVFKLNGNDTAVTDSQFQVLFELESEHAESINPQIENNFSYHPPKEGQAMKYETVRDSAKNLANIFDALAPDSREKSTAMTKLEEAVFWINASIARNE